MTMNKIIPTVFFIILFSFKLCLPQTGAQENNNNLRDNSDEAIIILSSNTINEMLVSREFLEHKGMKVKNIFPPSVLIGTVPHNIIEEIKNLEQIEQISYGKVDSADFKDYNFSAKEAINLWNDSLEKQLVGNEKAGNTLEVKEKTPWEISLDQLIIPQDLPKTKDDRIKKDKIYQQHWQERILQITNEEAKKKRDWEQKRKGHKKTATKVMSVSLPFSNKSGFDISTSKAFGKTYGAGYYDTSLYMAGDIAVGVFFEPGNAGNWPLEEINTAFISISSALNKFITDEQNAHISFTFIKETNLGGSPKPLPENIRDYVNDLRNIYNTHWAYMVTVRYGTGRADAYFWGPSLRIYSSDLAYANVVRHETMHIFGALDQYASGGGHTGPVESSGYLGVVNANSVYNDGKGYFGGAGEGRTDIMLDSGPITGVYSRGQIGWRDSDGDGILDPLDTFPNTNNLIRTGNNPFTYTGKATDMALFNINNSYGDATLNSIIKVEFRLNGGAWCQAIAIDGAFDSGEENFTFTLPLLQSGTYLLEVRSTNSVGNTEISYARDKIIIYKSKITNIRPFANFSITPPEGSINTSFIFDTSLSSDIEDDTSALKVRWDYENDGIWDTSFSTTKTTSFRYSTSGTKVVKLEVKDTQGLTSIIRKQIEVAASDLPPKVFFTVTPESQQGDSFDKFKIALDATRSYDAEDDIRDMGIRWDFDDDGVWDTDYLHNLTIEHSYDLPTSLPVLSMLSFPNASGGGIYLSGNYAYLACGFDGLKIIDITNPNNSVLVGGYATSGFSRDVQVAGNYAYVIDSAHSGYSVSSLLIFDISNPRNPVLVGSFSQLKNPIHLYVSGGYAFIADVGLKIINISNPGNPILVASYESPVFDVCVVGNLAYIINGSSLKVLNISNANAPLLIGQYGLLFEAQSIVVSGNYAYIADASAGLKIINITNPQFPALVVNYDTPDYASEVYISGNYAYIADGKSGLQIIDITNPTAPVLVAGSSRISYTSTVEHVSVLGSYAYINDGDHLFQVLDVSYPFRFKVSALSQHWRIRGETIDQYRNISQITRDIWSVTYDHPPLLGSIEFSKKPVFLYDNSWIFKDWGWIDNIFSSGNYLFAIGSRGLLVIDISNPQTPVLDATYKIPNKYFYRHCISGNNAYVFDYSKGFYVIDISNPRVPNLIGSCNTSGYGQKISVSGSYAYIISSKPVEGKRSLEIIDIANPRTPTLVSYFDMPDAYGIRISGNYAYVAAGSAGFSIIDITNPSSPILAGSCDTPGFTGDVAIFGNIAYLANLDGSLQIIDITNPHTPISVGNYVVDSAHALIRLYLLGNYVYALTNGGLQGESYLYIIDVNDSVAPVLAGAYRTSGANELKDLCVSGNYTYIAEGTLGLEVMHIEEKLSSVARAVNFSDSDINTTWDGLLEYRWDFDNDGTWDTRFSSNSETVLPEESLGYSVACQVRDRFGATNMIIANRLDTIPPVICHTPIKWQIGNGPSMLKASIFDFGAGIKNAVLIWQKRQYDIKKGWSYGKARFLSMAKGEDGIFRAIFPAYTFNNEFVRYRIFAQDEAGNKALTPEYLTYIGRDGAEI